MVSTVKFETNNLPFTIGDIIEGEFNWNMYYVLNNMVFLRKSLLDTLMQIFIMLWHLVAEILRFKFDDYRVSRTGASELKLLLGGVNVMVTAFKSHSIEEAMFLHTILQNMIRCLQCTWNIIS